MDRQVAGSALASARAAEHGMARAIGYGRAGRHLLLWGLVWILGCGAIFLWPHRLLPLLAAMVATGCAGSALLGLASRRTEPPGETRSDRRPLLLAASTALFATLWPYLLRSGHPFADLAYGGSVTGFVFVVIGVWRGWPLMALGFGTTALLLAGLALPPAWFPLAAAFAGGLGVALAGIVMIERDPIR